MLYKIRWYRGNKSAGVTKPITPSIIEKSALQIARKKHKFYPFIKQKKYTKNSERLGNYLKSKNYTPVQTHNILVKDFYRTVKEKSENWNVFILGESQITV